MVDSQVSPLSICGDGNVNILHRKEGHVPGVL